MNNQDSVECLGLCYAQGNGNPRLLTWSSLAVEFLVVPGRVKNARVQPAHVDARLGGLGGNVSPVALANGISCGAIGIQGRTMALGDITPGLAGVIRSAQAVIIGPLPRADTTFQVLIGVSRLARYAAIRVHPSLLHDPQVLGRIASQYNYCQMNLAEAHMLDPGTQDIDLLACRVRNLVGDENEFCITDGGNTSWLWAERDWFRVSPPRVQVLREVGAGDVFCAGYVVARRFFGAQPEAALDYAVRVAAAQISGAAVPAYVT
jgi:hypothetical protein